MLGLGFTGLGLAWPQALLLGTISASSTYLPYLPYLPYPPNFQFTRSR